MATSLKFRIEADNSSGLRGISQVKDAAKDLGSDIQRHIGDKLKDVFKVTFIEEAVRRTAEWATELAKSSKELGVSVEALQALKVAEERAGIEQGKIFNYFQKIEAGALKALNGNKKLAESFRQLGVSSAELRKASTQELMGKALAAGATPAGQAALLNIFGPKEILNVQALMREMKGKTPEEYAREHESQIVPGEQVRGIAIAWTNILEDIKSIAVKLTPIIVGILAIVDGVMKMLNGVLGELGNIGKGALLFGKSFFSKQGDQEFQQWSRQREERNKASLRALGNFIPGMISLGFWKPFGEQHLGPNLTEEQRREAEGAAEALGTLGTFGTGGITKGIGMGAKGVSSAAGLVGAEELAGSAGGFAARMSGKAGGGLISRIKPLRKYILERQRIKAIELENKLEKSLGLSPGELSSMGKLDQTALTELLAEKLNLPGGAASAKQISEYLSDVTQGQISTIGGLLSTLSAGNIGKEEISASEMFKDISGLPPGSANRGIMLKNLGSAMGGAGGGALSVGGVYGVDIQSKLMSLNQTMVDLLEQIVVNTTPQFDGGGGNEEEGAGL